MYARVWSVVLFVLLRFEFVFSLAKKHLTVIHERIRRNFQIGRCGAFPNPPRDIVVGSMAWAEPPSVISSVRNRHTSEMSAYTQNDTPFWILHAGRVGLRIAQIGICSRHVRRKRSSFHIRNSSPMFRWSVGSRRGHMWKLVCV